MIVHNSEGFISNMTSIQKKTIYHLGTFAVWGFISVPLPRFKFAP